VLGVFRIGDGGGSAFRYHEFRRACAELGIAHQFTRAYRP